MSGDQAVGFAAIFGAFAYFPVSAAAGRLGRWLRNRPQLAAYKYPYTTKPNQQRSKNDER